MEEELFELADRRADQAEVFCEEADRTVVEFRAGRLHAQETRLTRGAGLRVIKDGRVGFASGTNPDMVEELVETALATAAFGRAVKFDFPSGARGAEVKTLDNRVLLAASSRIASWGRDLIEAMRARAAEVKFNLTFTRTFRDVSIRNSWGLDARFSRAEFDLRITGLAVDGGITWFPDYVNLSDGRPLEIEPVCDRLERLIVAARRRARLASGSCPVIVMPTALPAVLCPVALAVNGRHREKGTTPLAGREGEKLLSGALTVVDNPLRNYGLGSAPFDAEGVARKRNVLFEQGVFRGFLYDIATAAACGSPGTASASRDYSSPPVPGTSNVEVRAGDADYDKLVRETKKGLVVHGFIGGGQSNVLAGEITLAVSSGFKVESGEVTGRVKDAMVAGNVYELLSTVDAVGSVQEDLGDHFLPFVRFPATKVATREA